MDNILGLFKFGHRQHIDELVREGHVYMNPLSAFVQLESDSLRTDADEGLKWSIPGSGAKLQMEEGGDWLSVGTLDGPIKHLDPVVLQANVFCMYAFRALHSATLVDERNFGFGDTFVVFTDGNEFLRRAKTAAEKLQLRYEAGLVQYVDGNAYRGDMGIFKKFSHFSFQSEFRIALLPGTGRPVSLNLGDLRDIAMVGELQEINSRIKVERAIQR